MISAFGPLARAGRYSRKMLAVFLAPCELVDSSSQRRDDDVMRDVLGFVAHASVPS